MCQSVYSPGPFSPSRRRRGAGTVSRPSAQQQDPAIVASQAAENGTLIVHIDPPASLYVDATLVAANVAEQSLEVAAGLHRIRVIHPEYQDLQRVIRIERGKATTLSLPLADKAVLKPPPPPSTRRGGRDGAAANRAISTLVTEPDLTRGIEFVREGDFVPAAETLLAVGANLAGVPRMIGQLALAYLYLGNALVELDQTSRAKLAFALAQRADKALSPKPTEFSRQVISIWEQARSIPATEEIDLAPAARQTSAADDKRKEERLLPTLMRSSSSRPLGP